MQQLHRCNGTYSISTTVKAAAAAAAAVDVTGQVDTTADYPYVTAYSTLTTTRHRHTEAPIAVLDRFPNNILYHPFQHGGDRADRVVRKLLTQETGSKHHEAHAGQAQSKGDGTLCWLRITSASEYKVQLSPLIEQASSERVRFSLARTWYDAHPHPGDAPPAFSLPAQS